LRFVTTGIYFGRSVRGQGCRRGLGCRRGGPVLDLLTGPALGSLRGLVGLVAHPAELGIDQLDPFVAPSGDVLAALLKQSSDVLLVQFLSGHSSSGLSTPSASRMV
jgi:hypothetical protein